MVTLDGLARAPNNNAEPLPTFGVLAAHPLLTPFSSERDSDDGMSRGSAEPADIQHLCVQLYTRGNCGRDQETRTTRGHVQDRSHATEDRLVGIVDILNSIKTKKQHQNTDNVILKYSLSSASTWPQVLEDTAARKDWRWDPKYSLEKMVPYMLQKVRDQLAKEVAPPKELF